VSEWLPALHLVTLLTCLGIAAWTDVRARSIYNWTTFSGMAAAVLLAGLASLGGVEIDGVPTILDSLAGFFACGVLMVFCYIVFGSAGVGGGDVKLIAMLGAFFGLYPGFEALLWTIVLGACVGLIQLVWTVGAIDLVRRLWSGARSAVAQGGFVLMAEEERQTFPTHVFFGPCALAGAAIVRLGLIAW
jgi:Flp pilus assembly protein protease CpaA